MAGSPSVNEIDSEKKLSILSKLKENPRGMTIKQISESLELSRETVAKHVLALEYENEIYTVKFGNAEVYITNHKQFRDMDRIPINLGNRTIFLNRLNNDFGQFILISETRKKGDGWEKKGSVLIPTDKVKAIIKALKDIDERPAKIQQET